MERFSCSIKMDEIWQPEEQVRGKKWPFIFLCTMSVCASVCVNVNTHRTDMHRKLYWTGSGTLKPSIRRARAISTFRGCRGPLTSAGQCWGCFMSPCCPVCCCVRGQQIEGNGRQQAQQTNPQGQWHGGGGARPSGGDVREEEDIQVMCHIAQCVPLTQWRAGQATEYTECKTHSTEMHHTTVAIKLLNSSLRVSDNLGQ